MPDSNETTLFEDEATATEAVECLGMTFESHAARREHFLEQLKANLQDPDFRQMEGFPEAPDANILRLSDPPYFTACPNPFLDDFVAQHGTPYHPERDDYERTPFAADVSEGKRTRLYQAHGYHTKVPHKAIMRYLVHYTDPGDIVLDAFAGSGMMGVAAQLCDNPDPELKKKIEEERKEQGLPKPKWGTRKAILNDLGPAASFIAAGFNLPFDRAAFAKEAKRILRELKDEIGWMYETLHTDGKTKGVINYTVWSEVFSCPECAGEVVFVEEALDDETQRVKSSFKCPHCSTELDKKVLDLLYETVYDPTLGKPVERPKRIPALINYSLPGKKGKHVKTPDERDLAIIDKITQEPLPSSVPTQELPYMHMTHERARMDKKGITHVHHFFWHRSALALGRLWEKAQAIADRRLRNQMLWFVEQAIWGMSLLNRYSPTHYSQVNRNLTGVYYIASQLSEVTPWYILDGKLTRLKQGFKKDIAVPESAMVMTGTATTLPLSDNTVDYVFTDPPFGENIYYADLNYLVESWHGVFTESEPEAIVDQAKNKDLIDYKRLMQACFDEYFRVLKPGRWITVVFHNSKNAVWNAIQEALQAVGFIIADVSVLDKKQGSYRQVTSDTTKKDLVITAYKPSRQFELNFGLEAGTEEGAWQFVRSRLAHLAMPRLVDGVMEFVGERSQYMLFDRMVAFHVSRGTRVPLSNAEFFEGLQERFAARDDMYFLPEQVAEYDKKRVQAQGAQPLTLLVTNEATAIQWLRQELDKKPRTFAELQPEFMQETQGWSKLEAPLDLRELLEQNFLRYDGSGPVPSQIHSYLSTNFHDMRNREKDDVVLQAKAQDRWYVPDPNKAEDLEKLRERELLKVFREYVRTDKKRIRPVRIEALKAGFQKAYQDNDYQTILAVAEKVPEDVIGEDDKLLRFYDFASLRAGDDQGPLFE